MKGLITRVVLYRIAVFLANKSNNPSSQWLFQTGWKQWEWCFVRIHLRREDVSVAAVVIFLGSQFLLRALRLVLSTMLCWFKPVSRFNLCLGSDEYP